MSQVKERPILFSAPMVRAILEDRKTVTRRAVRAGFNPEDLEGTLSASECRKLYRELPQHFGASYFCPYGQPGDRLWVRETWARVGNCDPGYLIITEDGRQVTKHMLRLRFDDARDKAIATAKEKGDGVLAASIRQFQFRDIRPKAASEILDLGDASRLLGHTDKRITETVYRRVGEIVKPTR